jgi:hypothetical protein
LLGTSVILVLDCLPQYRTEDGCLLEGIVVKPTNGISVLGKKSACGAQLVLEVLKVIQEATDLGVGDCSDTLHVLFNGKSDLQEPSEPVKDVV